MPELLEQFPEDLVQDQDGNIRLEYNNVKQLEIDCDQAQAAFKRSFDSEEHYCEICTRSLLGDKFTFLSSCEHFFCSDCLKDMIVTKINEGQIKLIKCAIAGCQQSLNDLDVKNVGLDKSMMEKYEQFSVQSAIEAMDDMCWCPLPTCGSVASIESNDNTGRCQHCDFHFCLDCKQHVHPFKRCLVNRIDLLVEFQDQMKEITDQNKLVEARLNELYIKNCTKRCPNVKCGARISVVSGGCSQIQCTQCWTWFCWVCLNSAKGQKHFKEKPDHWSDEGYIQPVEVTLEMIEQYMGMHEDPYINIKFCCKCPSCGGINRKRGRKNLLTCEKCSDTFCYICNKAVGSRYHYDGQASCHEESNMFNDL